MLKKQSIVLNLVLTLITLGIYMPIWFLRRLDGFNQLGTGRLTPEPFWIVLGIYAFEAILTLAELSNWHQLSLIRILMDQILVQLISLIGFGIITFETFKLRRMLEKAYAVRLDPLLLVLFSIVYLQHWINHLVDRPLNSDRAV